uniref:Amino_oxidase domain-containing protein n=1 Tax=Bursaphelenchus xylophilus TaxID=6326 RepID=A0A1I7S5U7_BURXY
MARKSQAIWPRRSSTNVPFHQIPAASRCMDHRITGKVAITIVLLIAGACGEIDPGIPDFPQISAEFGTKTLNSTKNDGKNVSIAIIGGGFAGLAAFGKLDQLGYENVELFEAAGRLGGRVYPVPYTDGFIQHGAQFINGAENPIFEMARRLGVVTREMDDDELFRNADYRTGKCSLDMHCVEEFEEFVEKLEFQIQEMARDPVMWNRTVATVYKEVFRGFIAVSWQ